MITEEDLKKICDTIKDFTTGTEISQLLAASKISNQGILSQTLYGGLAYKTGTSKSDTLYNSFANEINTSHKTDKIMDFITRLAKPVRFVGNKERYHLMIKSLNEVLIFIGKSINEAGKISDIVKAKTLDEADRRLNSLHTQFYNRKIHFQVEKYCRKDLLNKDFFDMVFEASKGLFERVREITELTLDGRKLAQTVFNQNNPYIVFSALKTKTEEDEQTGIQMLFESIAALLRNPRAHTPKINWYEDENKAMDALTMISFAHKYLDNCIVVPKK